MLTKDVALLKDNYSAIDHIAKRFDDLWHEQTMQAQQMGRIEKQLREELPEMKTRLDNMEIRLDRMEKILLLICKKLGINPGSV